MRAIAWLSSGLPALLLVTACNGGGSSNADSTGTDTDMGSTSGVTTTGMTTGMTDSASTTGTTTASTTGTGTTSGTSATTGTTGPSCPNPQPEDGTYSECNDELWFCSGGGFCLQDPDPATFGVCSRGCVDVCNCWPKPATGDAQPECNEDISQGNNGVCVLDCSGGRTCPDGMNCDPTFSICVFPDMGTGTGTGTGTSG